MIQKRATITHCLTRPPYTHHLYAHLKYTLTGRQAHGFNCVRIEPISLIIIVFLVRLRYFKAMLRVIAIFLLVMQALVAQAGVQGISCLHSPSGKSPHSALSAAHGQASQPDQPPRHEMCCCDVIGSCASSALASDSLASDMPSPHPVYPLARTTSRVQLGFVRLPYRPPSFAI